MTSRILVIDDDRATLRMVELALKSEGHVPRPALSLAESRDLLQSEKFDLILSDLYLKDGTGLELLQEHSSAGPPFIMFTARGNVETAVEAIAGGVFDYLAKPFSIDSLLQVVNRALASRQKPARPVPELSRDEPSLFVGTSPAMVELYKKIALVAPTDTTVLITGETGTGKELVALALHRFSDRKDEPFVAINCGALTETLLDSELFGHRRGAFTDADSHRTGLFESASRGTIFLDEISETSLAFQVKLLRTLQEHEVRPVGSNTTVKTRMRVVAASNRSLEKAIREGTFRQDLFYRLSVVHLDVPSLGDRIQDLPQLADFFLARVCKRLQKPLSFDAGALKVLGRHSWPGNIRELENAIERAAVLKTDAVISAEDFGFLTSGPEAQSLADLSELDRVEREKILLVLTQTGGNKAEAARRLGIERKTLYRKARRLRIELDFIGSPK